MMECIYSICKSSSRRCSNTIVPFSFFLILFSGFGEGAAVFYKRFFRFRNEQFTDDTLWYQPLFKLFALLTFISFITLILSSIIYSMILCITCLCPNPNKQLPCCQFYKKSICKPKTSSIILALLGISSFLGLILIIIGNNFTVDLLEFFFSSVHSTLNTVDMISSNISNDFDYYIELRDISLSLNKLSNSILAPYTTQLEIPLFWTSLFRGLVVYGSLLLGGFFAILSLSSAISKSKGYSLCVSGLSILIIFIMIISSSIHVPLSLAVDDLCATADNMNSNFDPNKPEAFENVGFKYFYGLQLYNGSSVLSSLWNELETHILPNYNNTIQSTYPNFNVSPPQFSQYPKDITKRQTVLENNILLLNNYLTQTASFLIDKSNVPIRINYLNTVIIEIANNSLGILQLEDNSLFFDMLSDLVSTFCPKAVLSVFIIWVSNSIIAVCGLFGIFTGYYASLSYRGNVVRDEALEMESEDYDDNDINNSMKCICFDEEGDPLTYTKLLLESITIVQLIVGVIQLARVEWKKDDNIQWDHLSVQILFVLCAVMGFYFAYGRKRMGILLFGILNVIVVLIYIIYGTFSVISLSKCSSDLMSSQFCSSTFFEGNLIVGFLILSLNVVVLILGAIFSFKFVYTLKQQLDPSYTIVSGFGDLGGF